MKGMQAAMLGGSAMILLVLALRLLLKKHLPRRLFPALWCAAAVRLLLPIEIPTRWSVWNLLRGAEAAQTRSTGTRIPFPALTQAVETATVQTAKAGAVNPILLIWAVGMALLAAYFLDFTLLGRFALPLALVFHAARVLLSLLPLGGFWFFRYTYVSTHILLRGLPPLLPLMFAVLLYALRGRRGLGIFAALTALAVQLLFCLQIPSLTDLSFLFLCNGALLIFCAHSGWLGLGAKWETLLAALPLAACTASVLVLGASWFARQLAIVLDSYPYIDGHGYQTVVLRELLQNAKVIGPGGVGPYSAQHLARWDGFGMVDLQAHALTLLVHRCGWLALIALVTLLTALLVLAFRRCRRQESMLARLVSYSVLLSFTTQAAAYLCCDLTLIPISGGVAFPFFTFGIKTILLNMLQLGFLLSTLRVGSVVRDKDIAAGPVRPRRRLRVSFTWENA